MRDYRYVPAGREVSTTGVLFLDFVKPSCRSSIPVCKLLVAARLPYRVNHPRPLSYLRYVPAHAVIFTTGITFTHLHVPWAGLA